VWILGPPLAIARKRVKEEVPTQATSVDGEGSDEPGSQSMGGVAALK
jgi:hypothetical protein